jgi:hypothetical protein
MNGIYVSVNVNDKLLALAAIWQELITKNLYKSHAVKFQQKQ